MAEETLKTKFDTIEEQRLYDVQAKIELAKYIVRACIANEANPSALHHNRIFEEASKYFSNKIVRQLVTNAYIVRNKPKSLFDWDTEISSQKYDGTEECSIEKLFRDIIVDCYAIKKSIPTIQSIIKKFSKKKTWSISDIEMCLKMRGYKSRRLPRCTKTIIIEDPKQSFERMKYLYSIEQFRNARTHIVYIEEKIASKKGCFVDRYKRKDEDITLIHIAASSSLGIISKKFIDITKNSTLSHDNDKFPLIINWILDTVVPHVSTPSVFVLEDKLDNPNSYIETPTIYSSKNSMMKWLDKNDIPYSFNMHSAELFELIKKSSRNISNRKYVLDETLKVYGHKVLRRPRKTQLLNYFNIFWERNLHTFHKFSVNELSRMTKNDWQQLEFKLHEIERKFLEKDVTVDETIEAIFTFSEHEEVLYEDIKNLDESADEIKVPVVVPF